MESRFSLYDFLGFIIPGYLVLGSLIFLFVPLPTIRAALDSVEPYKYIGSFATILIAYGAGHLVSQVASLVGERLLIGKWLGYPSENFFHTQPGVRLFKDYRRPYAEAFAKEWKQRYEATLGGAFHHREAFLNAFHYVKEHSRQTLERLNTFIAIYDFARNTALAMVVIAMGAGIQALRLGGGNYVAIAGVALLTAVLFFYRYLKFFRHYTDEVFRTFHVLSQARRQEL